MEYKGLFVLVAVVAISCGQSAAFPRDSSVVQSEEISFSEAAPAVTQKDQNTVQPTETEHLDDDGVLLPWKVSCESEEVTEDKVCQEHCLPKGYSFGLCVEKQCSCV